MIDIAQRNIDTLQQLKEFILKISPQEYGRKDSLILGASIGQHVRHILEFYVSIFSNRDMQTVNYDKRKRDLTLETDPEIACEVINQIFVELNKTNSCRAIELEVEVQTNSGSCEEKKLKSSLSRELIYALDHTIHHMAIIRIAGQFIQNGSITFPKSFGVAPSTIKHQESTIAPCVQ
jgi:uncharacterized damage-inducible protein DinB